MHIPFFKPRCSHQMPNGAPCHATPQKGKDFCFFHDPERAAERTAARRQGGLTSIGKAAPVVPPNLLRRSLKTHEDVRQLYEDIINYVLQGQVDLRTANSLRSLANGVLRTIQSIERAGREASQATLPGKGLFSFPKPFPSIREFRAPRLRPSASENNDSPSLPGKDVSFSSPTAGGNTGSASNHQLEIDPACSGEPGDEPRTENAKLETAPQPLPDKGVNTNQTGVPHSRPSASGNNSPQSLPGKDVPFPSLGGNTRLETGNVKPETAPTHSRSSASRNNNDEILLDKDICHSSPSEDTELETRNLKLETVLSGDMAQKKLGAQNLAVKKELAYALAPTTMKYSTFNDEGLVVAKPAGESPVPPPEPSTPPAPARDPDYEPSPIPGLQNRHLNYLKYMGAPVSVLQRIGFVFPRRRW